MSATTGPVLAAGTITVINATVFNDEEMDWRVPVATVLAAGGFYLVEKVAKDIASVMAWTLVITTLMTRMDPRVPSPMESAVRWWDTSRARRGTTDSREV